MDRDDIRNANKQSDDDGTFGGKIHLFNLSQESSMRQSIHTGKRVLVFYKDY